MNKDIAQRIHKLNHSDASWSFDDNSRPCLVLKTGGPRGWDTNANVDPFPCYSHNAELVLAEAREIEGKIPLPYPPNYFLLPFESLSRTNGWASTNKTYVDPEDHTKREPRPYIILSGKRIPLHPAMTRYLVAHEYGHVVHGNLANAMGIEYDAFERLYADEVRKIPYVGAYGGLKWHLNTGEIIANDVRVALLGKEAEFWPHEVTHPWSQPHIGAWWHEMFAKHFTPKPVTPAAAEAQAANG